MGRYPPVTPSVLKVRTAGYLMSVSTMAVLNRLTHDMLAALLLSPENNSSYTFQCLVVATLF